MWIAGLRAHFSKGPETFRGHKTIFSLSASKTGEVHGPETPCRKRSSVHIKNLWIKHLYNRKFRDIAMAFQFRAQKFPGLSRNGPLETNQRK